MQMKNVNHINSHADDVEVSKIPNGDTKRVDLHTLKLGQLRESGNEVGDESLEVRWSHNGQEQPQLNNHFGIDAKVGSWSVFVQFLSNEVRNDPNGLLQDTAHFTVTLPVNATVPL